MYICTSLHGQYSAANFYKFLRKYFINSTTDIAKFCGYSAEIYLIFNSLLKKLQ